MLSKKLKAKLKKIAINTTLAISTIVVLFVMCVNLDGRMNTVKEQNQNANSQEAKVGNEIAVIKDSTGINLKISGENESGINKIEVYQGTNKIGDYTYTDGKVNKTEDLKITIPFGETHQITVMVNGQTVAQKDIQNMRYISNAQDMVSFRNAVNDGNTFEGKYVELTADIDMSSVCSSTVGNWVPISNFLGTLNGNYYTIKNLYMSTNNSSLNSAFIINNRGVVTKIIFDNPYIYSTYSALGVNWGSVAVCFNYGIVSNIGVNNGSVTVNSTNSDTSANAYVNSGGICANNNGQILNCYNRASITGNHSQGNYARNGGICGCSGENGLIKNCYTTGTVSGSARSGSARIGGLIGENYGKLENSYSIGAVNSNTNSVGSIIGLNWYYHPSICYSSASNSYSYVHRNSNSSLSNYTTGKTSAANIKGYTSTLNAGSGNWSADTYNINEGYPILSWQVPTIEFDKKQVYVNVGEQVQLNLNTAKYRASQAIGTVNYYTDNADIATVDENGIVTAVGEGYTTIYATESTYTLKAMMIVNVAKTGARAYSQIQTGGYENESAFSIILKEDGTVWTVRR